MGIKLDWEIEADQSVVPDVGEDRLSRRRRRLAQLRIILGVLFMLGIFGSLFGALWWRLQSVNDVIERALLDTVNAEVATLRVADRNAYLNIQRSATDAWRTAQEATFDEYQRLKVDYDLQLTGNIVDVEIDGSRGRVQVEEIIDGVPYVQTWFYWRYAEDTDDVDDGWRHVPPDYTFWGVQRTIERGLLNVVYYEVDTPTATATADSVSGWLNFACGVITCDTLPTITIEILPIEGLPTAWSEAAPNTLQMPSPFVGRARLDRPFDTVPQIEVANLLAERLVNQTADAVQPPSFTTAAYLRGAIDDWFVTQFTQLDTESHLISTYATRYGEGAVGSVLAGITPQADLQLLANAAGVPTPAALEVDWRDYLAWRLEQEVALHTNRDQANYVALYDTRDQTAADLAFARFNEPLPATRYAVVAIQPEQDAAGVPVLRSIVRVGEGDAARDEVIQFRFIDGTWKRIS